MEVNNNSGRLLSENLENLDVKFSWFVIEVNPKLIKIKLEFDKPSLISSSSQDQLTIEIKDYSMFKSVEGMELGQDGI